MSQRPYSPTMVPSETLSGCTRGELSEERAAVLGWNCLSHSPPSLVWSSTSYLFDWPQARLTKVIGRGSKYTFVLQLEKYSMIALQCELAGENRHGAV